MLFLLVSNVFPYASAVVAWSVTASRGWPEAGPWRAVAVAASIAGNPLNKPDKPVTYHMPYSRYRINVFQPSPPEPYKD